MSSSRSERLRIKRKSVIIMADGVQVIGKASVAGRRAMCSEHKVEFGCGIPNITAVSYNKPILGVVVSKSLQMRDDPGSSWRRGDDKAASPDVTPGCSGINYHQQGHRAVRLPFSSTFTRARLSAFTWAPLSEASRSS